MLACLTFSHFLLTCSCKQIARSFSDIHATSSFLTFIPSLEQPLHKSRKSPQNKTLKWITKTTRELAEVETTEDVAATTVRYLFSTSTVHDIGKFGWIFCWQSTLDIYFFVSIEFFSFAKTGMHNCN